MSIATSAWSDPSTFCRTNVTVVPSGDTAGLMSPPPAESTSPPPLKGVLVRRTPGASDPSAFIRNSPLVGGQSSPSHAYTRCAPSGVNAAHPPNVETCTRPVPSGFTIQMPSLSVEKTIRDPSGDQSGAYGFWAPLSVNRRNPVPLVLIE